MTYSESSKIATEKYKKNHIKRIPLDVSIDFYVTLKAAADAAGESVNGYIKKSVQMRIDKDN